MKETFEFFRTCIWHPAILNIDGKETFVKYQWCGKICSERRNQEMILEKVTYPIFDFHLRSTVTKRLKEINDNEWLRWKAKCGKTL